MTIDKPNQSGGNASMSEYLRKRIGTEERGEMLKELADYEIERICIELELDDATTQVAKAIYRRSLNGKIIENTTVSELCASSSYAAIKVESEPYSLSDISSVSESDKKKIAKTFAGLRSQLQLEVGPVQPQHYVSRFCDELDLSKATEAKAIDIIDECVEMGVHSGKSPSAFAASSIYVAALLADELVTQQRIGEVADKNPRTIRNLYRQQIYAIAPEISEDEE